jgi:hypothetical protein
VKEDTPIVPPEEQPAIKAVRAVLVSPQAIQAMGEMFLRIEQVLGAIPPPDMDKARAERHRSIRVLLAVRDFIRQSWGEPASKDAQTHLFHLATRLEQLNDGVAHPMLRPEPRNSRRPDRFDIWEARECVCAAVECHMRSRKHTREAAARFIARQRPILKRLIRDACEHDAMRATKEKLADAIVSWHRQFQQGEANKVAQDMWSGTLQLLDGCGATTPENWAEMAQVFLKMALDHASALMLPSVNRT